MPVALNLDLLKHFHRIVDEKSTNIHTEMDEDNVYGFAGAMTVLVIALTFTLLITGNRAANRDVDFKQEAVDRGFAKWELIEGTKRTEFKWNDEKR